MEKGQISKPNIIEDQKELIEKTILEAWHNDIKITIIYFKNSKLYKLEKRIIKIIQVNKKIVFEDYSFVYFDQILKVSI